MTNEITSSTTSLPRRKLALVIGIGDYTSGDKLDNAVNDACDVSNKLKSIGFLIDGPKLDLTCQEMEEALIRFKYSIEEGDMVLFYFAGHGTQWEGQNFLIPKDDIDIATRGLRSRAVMAQKFLEDFTYQHPFVTIFILDCCRMYRPPIADCRKISMCSPDFTSPKRTGSKSMQINVGSLMIFACAPGTIAMGDELEQRNGLFTKYLLKHIGKPNEDIRMILADITRDVVEESEGEQMPYFSGVLMHRSICLNESVLEK